MIHPWQRQTWSRLIATEARRAHALLLGGPPGQGKRHFAEAWAARLLCTAPGAEGFACGQCAPCRLRLSGNHPDLLRLVPESEAAPEEAAGGKAKPSTQILIEQVRALRERLAVTGHQSGARVVLVDPAEAMNANTANALLKLLEEPPADTVFVLVCSAPRRLLPTIRSRCQQWSFARPEPEAASAWLAEHGGEGAEALLALSSGMPVAAARLAGQGGVALQRRFVTDLLGVPATDPLLLAGDWEAWLRSKDAAAAGFEMASLIDWMLRWVWDLTALRLGGTARYFPAQGAELDRLARAAAKAALLDCYNALVQIHRVARHPLNARLLLEDMLMRYARAIAPQGGRS